MMVITLTIILCVMAKQNFAGVVEFPNFAGVVELT